MTQHKGQIVIDYAVDERGNFHSEFKVGTARELFAVLTDDDGKMHDCAINVTLRHYLGTTERERFLAKFLTEAAKCDEKVMRAACEKAGKGDC